MNNPIKQIGSAISRIGDRGSASAWIVVSLIGGALLGKPLPLACSGVSAAMPSAGARHPRTDPARRLAAFGIITTGILERRRPSELKIGYEPETHATLLGNWP